MFTVPQCLPVLSSMIKKRLIFMPDELWISVLCNFCFCDLQQALKYFQSGFDTVMSIFSACCRTWRSSGGWTLMETTSLNCRLSLPRWWSWRSTIINSVVSLPTAFRVNTKPQCPYELSIQQSGPVKYLFFMLGVNFVYLPVSWFLILSDLL